MVAYTSYNPGRYTPLQMASDQERHRKLVAKQMEEARRQWDECQQVFSYTVTADVTTQIKAGQSATDKPKEDKKDKLKNLIAYYYRRK